MLYVHNSGSQINDQPSVLNVAPPSLTFCVWLLLVGMYCNNDSYNNKTVANICWLLTICKEPCLTFYTNYLKFPSILMENLLGRMTLEEKEYYICVFKDRGSTWPCQLRSGCENQTRVGGSNNRPRGALHQNHTLSLCSQRFPVTAEQRVTGVSLCKVTNG